LQPLGRSRPRRRGRRGLFVLALLALIAALSVSAYFTVNALSRPRIESLEPSFGDPGGEVVLKGRNFGPSRGDGRVDVDGMVPTSTSYLAWTDAEIRLRLPSSFDSGLLHVVTRKGRSNPTLFMNRARLPVLASGASEGGPGLHIASIFPEEGAVGSLVVITGSGFGESRGESEIRFAWAAGTGESSLLGDPSPPLSVSPSEADSGYELWSDKEIGRAHV
jgi:hypothetical protein